MQRPNLYINAIISHKAFALTEGILRHYRYKMITSPRYFHIFAIQIPQNFGVAKQQTVKMDNFPPSQKQIRNHWQQNFLVSFQ